MALRILQLGTVFAIGLHFSPAISITETTGVASELPPVNVQITVQDDVIAVKGQAATLICDVQSMPQDTKFDIEWLHNDEPIPKNDSKRIIQQDGSLYIPKVFGGKKTRNTSCLTGNYRCKIISKIGILLSNPTKLRVASFDRDFHKLSNDLSVFESQPIVLFCIIHSVPTAEIQWERNTKSLPQNSRYVPLPTGALLITKTHSSDAGSYRCSATNKVLDKTKRSKPIQLSITSSVIQSKPESPTFLPLDILPNTTVLLGDTIHLYCAVTGWPNPTIHWINDANKIVGNGSLLNIENATLQNAGNYTCEASNSAGQNSQTFLVQVYQKPYFNVTPTSRLYPNSHTARLDCQAKGVPQPEIEFYKDGKRLIIDARIKNSSTGIVLSQTFSRDSGIYQCFASNPVGRIWVAAQILITSNYKLNPPQNVKCRPFDDTSICLTWQPPSNVSRQVYNTVFSFIHKDTGLESSAQKVLLNETAYLATGLYPRTNYTFYIRSYAGSASDESNNVTCQTGIVGKRDLRIIPINDTSVELKWNKISKDVPCEDTNITYKVMWRRKGRSLTFDNTEKLNYLITGLSTSNEYEFNVATKYDNPPPQWTSFILSNSKSKTNKTQETNEVDNKMELGAPESVEAVPISPNKINLTWFQVKGANYYNICYTKVKDENNCEDGTIIKSSENTLEFFKLEPNTLYEFKVKAHKSEEQFGPYSKSIEICTPADVPSTILELNYKIVNSSAICLYWVVPLYKNDNLINYQVKYTSDINLPPNKWYSITVPAFQRKAKSCWHLAGENTVSVVLGNLESDKNYTVLVSAKSDVGAGTSGFGYFTTMNIGKNNDYANDSQNNIQHNQKLGIIMGVTIALICIIFCVSCILARKQCLKSRAMARARMTSSNNYYPAIAHYASEAGAVQVRLEDPCAAEIHEIEHLVSEDQRSPATHTHIPPITNTAIHLDTKGAANFPNGHINGSFKPQANGTFNITENPRYLPECNGHIKKRSRDQFEEDSNSNLKPSKLQDLQRLFDSSKLLQYKPGTIVSRDRSKLETKCNRNIENESNDTPLHNGTLSEEDSFNATQYTFVDNSLDLSHRRISPVLGPNG